MPGDNVWLLVLARDPAGAKSRLSGVLDERARAELALAMLADVLAAARAVPFTRRIVVTESDTVRALALNASTETLTVPRSDTNGAAMAALTHACHAGASRALILAADLPLLRPDDLLALLEASADTPVVIGQDRHSRGTNALLLAPPLVIAPAFGPDSLRLHRERGDSAGARVRVVTTPGTATDVDDADDLRLVRSSADIGAHTRETLGALAKR